MINYLSQEKLSGSKGVQLPSIPNDLDIWLEPKALRVGTLHDNEEVINLVKNTSRYDQKRPAGEGIHISTEQRNVAQRCASLINFYSKMI